MKKAAKRKRAKKRERAPAEVAVRTPDEEGLSLKAQRFVDAYMSEEGGGNGTRAMRMVGHGGTDNACAVAASAMLRNPQVQEAIRTRLEHDPLVMSRIARLRLLSGIADGTVTEVELTLSGDPVARPAKIANRIAAAKLLGDMAGETSGKVQVEHSGSVGLVAMSTAELARELAEDDGETEDDP